MKEMFVNQIDENDGAIHGAVGNTKVVIRNLITYYGEERTANILHNIELIGKNAFSITRMYQYVCFLQHDKELGLSMRLSDFKGSMDSALDEYNLLTERNWQLPEKDKYMKIVQDIIDSGNKQEAFLTVVAPTFLL